jgi:hypothetical protein
MFSFLGVLFRFDDTQTQRWRMVVGSVFVVGGGFFSTDFLISGWFSRFGQYLRSAHFASEFVGYVGWWLYLTEDSN